MQVVNSLYYWDDVIASTVENPILYEAFIQA